MKVDRFESDFEQVETRLHLTEVSSVQVGSEY